MLPRSRPARRIHPDCPADLKRQVDVVLATALRGKPMFRGDTLVELVARHCPDVFAIVAGHGFELRFDMPENTQAAMLTGKINYQIRRQRLH